MAEYAEPDYHRVAHGSTDAELLPGSNIEVVREVNLAEPPQHVLFDFDGTLSLVREGWPNVMVPMMVDELRQTGTDQAPEQLVDLVYDMVMKLTGKQTIYQMIQLADEVRRRGGQAKEPAEYKARYHELLMQHIGSRREDLRSGRIPPADMLVTGTINLLDALRDRGAQLYLASGTDEQYVRDESALLQIDSYFGHHIYGAVDDYKSFSKSQVIQRILDENKVDGSRLVGFGDGYVEIQNIKQVKGTAVGVASDEANRSGQPDPWKRDRLIGVGADMIVPDYQNHKRIVDYLWDQVV